MLKKMLERPLACKEIQPLNPKGNSPGYSLEGLMLKLKFQYFGQLMRRTNSLEKILMLGKIEGGRRRITSSSSRKFEGQRMTRWFDGITDSMFMKFEQALGDVEL